MGDRELVAAIVAGDLAGLADAYDQYAESLHGYCRWMVTDPDDAADAVQDTFVIAAGKLGDLQDPRKLRPWLYAVARSECYRRLRTAEAGSEEAADLADLAAEIGDNAERAELRRLVRAALSGLVPGEREVLELSLRHGFRGTDLAAVLGVSRNQAHALARGARDQLEKALGALLVARTGRRACRALGELLAGWDGRLTVTARKRISRHIDQCETCAFRKRAVMRPAALFGMAPLGALPRGLRGDVLRLCADGSQLTLGYRREVMLRAGTFGPNGFPPPVRAPRQRITALPRIAAAAGVVIALASAGILTALALGVSPAPHSLDAARATRSATASGTANATPSVLAPPATSPASSPATR
nr:sigma-70 family RNA polymerase sigma factor [Actinomycetota bacterium]